MRHRRKFIPVTKIAPCKKNRGMALLACVFLTLFLGVLIGSAFMSMGMQLKESDQRILSHDSFYTAEAGLEDAVFKLRQDNHWRPAPVYTNTVLRDANDPQSVIGTYRVRVSDPGDTYNGWPFVWVRSDGIDNANQVPRSIVARVIIQSPTNFLAFTLGDLTIRSGAHYDYGILARDVNFKVDSALPENTPQHDISVDGKVSYMRTVTGYPGPGVTITGGAAVSPPITFTGVDLSYYQARANQDGAYKNSSFTSFGRMTRNSLGTANGVVYVDGDLHLSGSYEQDLVFVAKGNIYIDGNLTAAAPPGSPKPQLGLFAKQNVVIPASAPSDIEIEAFVLADGGTFTAESTQQKQRLKFTGAMAVRGQDGTLGIDLNAYGVREYYYNTNFTSSTIPFLPSIANAVTWQEVNPNDPFPPQ